MLQNAVTAILNSIIQKPSVLQASKPDQHEPLAIIKLQNEVNREMSKATPGSDTQKLLLALAAEKYAGCADTYSTLALRAIFEKHRPAVKFDCGLFDATVDKVLVGSGHVSLRLTNGQTLPESVSNPD